jgi:DNA-binding CsgD family transcriptional regulator/energy-coupling factor transporter ATP-binding protein EcfA2
MLAACDVPRHPFGGLVGRTAEQQALLALLDSLDSAGSAAMLVGEAGMGKTALLTHLAAIAAARTGTRVIWLRGEESEAVLAFAAAADLLLPLREHFACLPEGQRFALEACLALSGAEPCGPLAACAGALGVLSTAADQTPLVILIDDFHWVDLESRKILQFIARRLLAEPIVMVIAVRDEPGLPVVTAGLPAIRLSGLGYDDCAELARQRRIAIAPDNLRSLVQRSGGNPLVVLENLASAADMAGYPGDEQLVLHSSVDRVWSQVLMQLPTATQRALFVVAASHGAGSAGLGTVLGEVGLSLQSLEPAERRGLVRRADDGVRLCHPLLRSVVLDHTPLADRIEVYQVLARASDGSLRAWYQAAAATGPDEAAAGALVVAAEDARRRSGYGAAARAWRRAAELSTTMQCRVIRLMNAANDAFLAGDPHSAVAWCEEALRHCRDPVLTADIKLIQGRARTWMGDPQRSYDDLVQAADMIQPLDGARAANLLAEATLPAAIAGRVRLMMEVATRAESVWQGAGTSLSSRLISPHALAMVAEAFVLSGSLDRGNHFLSLAEKSLPSADLAGKQQGIASLGQSLICMERYSQASGHLNAVIDSARQKGAPAVLAIALAVRSDLGWWNGHWAAAYADATESLQWAEETGQAAAMGYSLVQLARIDAARGDRDRCATRTERAHREVEMRGVGCLAIYSAAALGLCALGRGDFAIAVDHLERAWMLTRADGMDNPNVVPFGGDLVEALARIGEIARASEILAWLEERAETTGLRYPRIAAARGRAVIEEDPSAAQEWFVRALSACEGPSMPFERARTLLSQGESLRRARRPAAAREPLRHALMIFRSLGAQPWITRTVTELGAAGVRGSAADRTGDGTRLDELTPQELQIARAVGRGLNNVEAAAALFVSRKTVEAHLTRAYRKLGVRSRTELTRMLLAHDTSD